MTVETMAAKLKKSEKYFYTREGDTPRKACCWWAVKPIRGHKSCWDFEGKKSRHGFSRKGPRIKDLP
ncbi:Cleavage And Polyadenylation Specificity Factor Subunit 4-Like Protein-Like [Manis pentadactyla]|nr:Cleavage And Polyadenylation Specificity Factor Subunit 4-Like Protein-Like [Manis pentadactyla]